MVVDQKGYRRYHATVERALTLFDANSEWADYIAFLSRLLKSLETGKPDGLVDIPCKTRISLCLSRCLQPTLPSGVHQKALDVYAEVFAIIGIDGLRRDLSLYLPGLSHTLAFANLATRPLVLDLFDTYILRFPPAALKPALKALILSLLPVIEEETSEDFDRCLNCFDALRIIFIQQNQEFFFWQTFFVASIANPLRRAGVLVYLTRFLPKLSQQTSDHVGTANAITTPEPGLLVRCFATGLRDSQLLIQRGFLDLLVTHLALTTGVLQAENYRRDLDVLVQAALMVVLRRDMSLNRRLWTWLMGVDAKSLDAPINSPAEARSKKIQKGNEYFEQFGLPSLIRSLEQELENNSSLPAPRTIPFRVMLSLMDRWEIGGPVVRAIFAPLMKNLMHYQSTAPSQGAFDEVFRSANVFFDSLESATLFACFSDLLHSKDWELLTFMVANFNIERVDAARTYIVILSTEVSNLIAQKGIDVAPWTTFLNDLTRILFQIEQSNPDKSNLNHAERLLESISRNIRDGLQDHLSPMSIAGFCMPFEQAVLMSPSLLVINEINLVGRIRAVLNASVMQNINGPAIGSMFSQLLSSLLRRFDDLPSKAQQETLNLIPDLVISLWSALGPNTPQYHVVAVESLWRLHDIRPEEQIVEATILRLFNEDSRLSSSQTERFGVLYHHTKTIKRTSDDTVPLILQRAALRIIDDCRGEDRSENGVRWILSLQDNSALFKLVLDTVTKSSHIDVLTTQRVQKLVRIFKLSEEHWRAFSSTSSLQLLPDFCLATIGLHQKQDTDKAHTAFMILRMIYGASSGIKPSTELLATLVDMLEANVLQADLQEEVLETLLAILDEKSILPSSLVHILLRGLMTMPIDERLDKWITLLCNFLPNHEALLASLLKVTSGFCKRIEEAFADLQAIFNNTAAKSETRNPDRAIANLLSGLEYMLARAHQQVANDVVPSTPATNGTPHDQKSGRSRANERLTVVLCMQDAVRICVKLWSWKLNSTSESTLSLTNDAKSFQYAAMKLRSRSRKILENLIEAEEQECLETLIEMRAGQNQGSVLDLLQTLNGARPRAMMPAVFSAIYSRTKSSQMTTTPKSIVSVQIGPVRITDFLIEYTTALEDDMLEEIWSECAAFLREILANPMPHRQLLIKLLYFCSIISQKMENTSFGEESRMHRELADICARLFTAIFTIKPTGFDGTTSTEKSKTSGLQLKVDGSILPVLVETLPHLSQLLSQSDKLNTVYAGISANITGPSLHARSFPRNLRIEHLQVLKIMSSRAIAAKIWRKDILDSFNNAKIFCSPVELASQGWLPLLKQFQTNDKTILVDTLNKLISPAAAGIVLGIGATAARIEADRRTQYELKKIATLIMAMAVDAVLPHLQLLFLKIEDLFNATTESSPSIATRGDVYLLIRTLLLKVTHPNLSVYWPIIEEELQSLCKDILLGPDSRYSPISRLQGAKLLDVLLLMRPDEFQLHEWLFITDSIEAIYPSENSGSTAYADLIAPLLGMNDSYIPESSSSNDKKRKPWLHGDKSRDVGQTDKLLASFFGQLSIRTFEDLYSLEPLDEELCLQDLLADIFTDTAD